MPKPVAADARLAKKGIIAMTKADPAQDPAPPPVGLGTGPVAVLRRLGMVVLVVSTISVSGVAIYRNLRDRAGVPVAIAPAPAPRETHAASVEDVITRSQTQVERTPDDADAWRMLGWSHFQRQQYAQSAAALRQATRLDPTNARTFSFLGEALLLAKRPQRHMPREARTAFDHALRLDPKDARARYYRAVGWDLAGQHRRAIHAWFALLRDTPPDAPYAADIRAVIRTVGARHHIKVEKRLAEVQYVPPDITAPATGKPPVGPGRAAPAVLPGPIGHHMRAIEGVPEPAASGSHADTIPENSAPH